jgi:hypothetical protein
MPSAEATRDHEQIRRWAEERGGIPTVVDGTELLRIDFVNGPRSGGREPRLREISWDDWFRIFDQNDLVFLYDPRDESRFFKLVAPDTLQEKQKGTRSRSARTSAPAAPRRSTAAAGTRRSTGRKPAGVSASRRSEAGRRGAADSNRGAAKRATQGRKSSGLRRSRKTSRD